MFLEGQENTLGGVIRWTISAYIIDQNFSTLGGYMFRNHATKMILILTRRGGELLNFREAEEIPLASFIK